MTSLTTNVTGGTAPYQYLYNFGDGTGNTSLASNTTTHRYLTVGTYSPNVTVTYSGGSTPAVCRTTVAATNPTSTISAVENFHLECDAVTLVCEAVEGPGTNSCQANSDCVNIKIPAHVREAVDGPGTSSCQANSDCVNIKIPAHSVCNKTKKICKSYFGYGPSTCSSNNDCDKTETGSVFLTVIAFLGSVSLLSLGYMIIIKSGRK